MFGIFRRRRYDRTGFTLYGLAVQAARDAWFYTEIGAPDTLDGRFDMVGLHVFLLIRRLQALPEPGAQIAQAVFDAMFADMDINLREMGVGDLSVGKRVKAMWEAFHGRAVAYGEALGSADPTVLADALRRNVWRGAALAGNAERLAELVRIEASRLDHIDLDAFRRTEIAFAGPTILTRGLAA